MKFFHAHTPNHSLTPSHMPMLSVAIVTSNANDTQIPSLCRPTNTQCNLSMGYPSQVNPDSYHSTLGLSDKHDRVFSFGQQKFLTYTTSLLHLHITFWIASRVSHTHTEIWISLRVSYTHKYILDISAGLLHPYRTFHLRGLMAPFLLRPTHLNSKTREFSNLWKNGKIIISVKTRNFFRSRMTKRISPLESSRGI